MRNLKQYITEGIFDDTDTERYHRAFKNGETVSLYDLIKGDIKTLGYNGWWGYTNYPQMISFTKKMKQLNNGRFKFVNGKGCSPYMGKDLFASIAYIASTIEVDLGEKDIKRRISDINSKLEKSVKQYMPKAELANARDGVYGTFEIFMISDNKNWILIGKGPSFQANIKIDQTFCELFN